MKTYFHGLISFLQFFCNCQLSSIPQLPSSCPVRLASRNWTPFYTAAASVGNFLCNQFARTTQKTQPLYCWEGVLLPPLHTNVSYLIVACVFVAVGICLPSRCLTMNVCSDFTIPAFGRQVTIFSCHELNICPFMLYILFSSTHFQKNQFNCKHMIKRGNNVKLYLYLIQHQSMKTCVRSGEIYPRILKLRTNWC
jgi:hypothetical protein